MNALVTVITLGVADVARARRFYCDGLGFVPSSASNEHVVFVQAGRIVLALFGRVALAEDAAVKDPGPGAGTGTFSVAHNLGSKAEVDAALEAARRAGATITKPAHDTFWGGYSGYFADPDGHLWEVAWNPFWPIGPDGHVTLPA